MARRTAAASIREGSTAISAGALATAITALILLPGGDRRQIATRRCWTRVSTTFQTAAAAVALTPGIGHRTAGSPLLSTRRRTRSYVAAILRVVVVLRCLTLPAPATRKRESTASRCRMCSLNARGVTALALTRRRRPVGVVDAR